MLTSSLDSHDDGGRGNAIESEEERDREDHQDDWEDDDNQGDNTDGGQEPRTQQVLEFPLAKIRDSARPSPSLLTALMSEGKRSEGSQNAPRELTAPGVVRFTALEQRQSYDGLTRTQAIDSNMDGKAPPRKPIDQRRPTHSAPVFPAQETLQGLTASEWRGIRKHIVWEHMDARSQRPAAPMRGCVLGTASTYLFPSSISHNPNDYHVQGW